MDEPALDNQTAESGVRLDIARVLILSVLSTGLYLLFWLYFTWKQLQPETKEPHFPFWHALTLFVPVYGLFRLHRHFSLINELAVKAGSSSLTPGAGVTLVLLSNVLAYASLGIKDIAAGLVLTAISTGLTTTALVFAQDGLNSVWLRRNAAAPQKQGAHWAEVVLPGLGLLGWIGAFFPG